VTYSAQPKRTCGSLEHTSALVFKVLAPVRTAMYIWPEVGSCKISDPQALLGFDDFCKAAEAANVSAPAIPRVFCRIAACLKQPLFAGHNMVSRSI